MSRLWSRGLAALLAAAVVLAWLSFNLLLTAEGVAGAVEAASTVATLFLSLFLEAAPFLLLGALVSGLVEVYVGHAELYRWAARGRVRAVLAGAALGFFLPVGECGAVVVTRRLIHKGLPPSASVAFLLAAPVLNPIAIAGTAAAFGLGRVLFLRLGLTLLIATAVGLTFAAGLRPEHVLRAAASVPLAGMSGPRPAWRADLRRALIITVDEFFELGAYLVAGAFLAALLQTWLPQASLLAPGTGPLISVVSLLALAVSLSVGSAVDAFAALSFAGTVSTGALLAFLVLGPMVDIKRTLMYLGVFRRATVTKLTLLPLLLTLVSTVFINIMANR